MHLRDLILKIRDAWAWTPGRYPKMDLTDSTSARQHVLLHVLKTVGTMASCQERYDHGIPFGSEEHRAASIKLLIDALQMLALENMSEDEICLEVARALAAANG